MDILTFDKELIKLHVLLKISHFVILYFFIYNNIIKIKNDEFIILSSNE